MKFSLRLLLLLVLILTGRPAGAMPLADVADSLSGGTVAPVCWERPDTLRRPSLLKRIGRGIVGFIEEFDRIDTAYIEPQQYNFETMIQNTNTYEVYRISDKEGHSITFAPEWSYKIGPYIGWRWAFFGYTLDINHLDLTHNNRQRQEYDLSLYTSMFGIDLYYRKSGDDYKIRHINLGGSIDTSPLSGKRFDGFKSSIKGFNIYYIFNHRKFSYPAAFSQSTVQRRSAGSPLLGVGYTRHTLSIDWDKLDEMVYNEIGEQVGETSIDSSLLFGTIKYTDVSVSGGYAYNWVFAHNWLLAGSLSVGLSYKKSTGDFDHEHFSLRDFSFRNVSLDGIGRFGIVYNNSKWYAGGSMTLHAYNYSRSQFSTNNFFGAVNFYIGFNFGRRKKQ